MKLIAGLGNPGRKYNLTRHNAGFMVIEKTRGHSDVKFKSTARFKALTAECLIGEKKAFLAMPQTFMNLSGHSVCSIVNWFKIGLDEILLIVDDIALPFGKIRIRPKGSDAGHKGLKSVIDCLGTNGFSRMRIGIMGRKVIKNSSEYVLGRFTRKEQKALPDILERAVSACECWAGEGVTAAMNRFN